MIKPNFQYLFYNKYHKKHFLKNNAHKVGIYVIVKNQIYSLSSGY